MEEIEIEIIKNIPIEKINFYKQAIINGLKEEDFGKEIIINGEKFNIIGWDNKKRSYPIILENLENEDPKSYTSVEEVLKALGRDLIIKKDLKNKTEEQENLINSFKSQFDESYKVLKIEENLCGSIVEVKGKNDIKYKIVGLKKNKHGKFQFALQKIYDNNKKKNFDIKFKKIEYCNINNIIQNK